MQIAKALTLFDYISDNNQATSTLENLANKQASNIASSIQAVDDGLSLGQFEETLDKIESGEIEVNSETLQNYFEFNKNRLTNQFSQLIDTYQITTETEISIQDDKLTVSGDTKSAQQLQQYLDSDQNLNRLIQQSSRLSKLIEWDQAKQQASIYKEQDMTDEKIVDFLKDSRKIVGDNNKLLFTNAGLGFDSEGQTQAIIEQTEPKQEKQP
ncbi:hypothetical protein RS130_03335 [Paraglaciecola aquimarina]|uniref:Uncharacterized protein n=1 Tax=Paraglaciecola aquimarina TaxID=1235557 RepID=A0ABU3SSX0_9ALTE|nr:hypothetical protein [Paraglaciecola aquimarina]MDU0353091.1 hypothetical protein [Paraglaciecola aquimarina]